MESSRLGFILCNARESRGWSLQEAAEVIGTTKSHLHDLDTGKQNNPTLRMIAGIVIAYGIRPEMIIACATQNTRTDPSHDQYNHEGNRHVSREA